MSWNFRGKCSPILSLSSSSFSSFLSLFFSFSHLHSIRILAEEGPLANNDIGPNSRHSASNIRVPTLIVYIISLSHGTETTKKSFAWDADGLVVLVLLRQTLRLFIYATVPTWCSERGHPCPLFTIHFFFWPVHLRKNAWDESGVETPYVFSFFLLIRSIFFSSSSIPPFVPLLRVSHARERFRSIPVRLSIGHPACILHGKEKAEHNNYDYLYDCSWIIYIFY